ncbi:hypothetical protein Hanom_Chr08g00724601 [Helianthus anomalus]
MATQINDDDGEHGKNESKFDIIPCEVCVENEECFKQKRTILEKKEDFLNKTYVEVAQKEEFLEQKIKETVEFEEYLNQTHSEFEKKKLFLIRKCKEVLEKENVLKQKEEELTQNCNVFEKENEMLKQKCSTKCNECIQKGNNIQALQKEYDVMKYSHHWMKEAYDEMKDIFKDLEKRNLKLAETKRFLEANYKDKKN